MKGKASFSHLLLLLSLMLLIESVFVDSSQQAAIATVSVSPSSVTASVGQNFKIDINISNVFDLYGWEFRLNWTATLIDAVNVAEGPFLKTGGSTFFTYNANATAGRMVVDCTLLGNVPGVNGGGTLATITFYVKNVGQSPLNLYNVVLLNSLEQEIPNQDVGGYGYFTYPHDVAVTNINFSPGIVLPGDKVKINVTVQNLGGFAEVFNVTVYANSRIIGMHTVSLSSGSSAIIPFVWDTTGFGKGDYTVSASASVVPGEVNTANNSKVSDSTLTILYPGHDVDVIKVQPLKTVVGQGYGMFIAITVKNYGVYSETFNTTAYANATAVAKRVIQTQTVTLTSGSSVRINFTWNTSGFAKGNYTISGYATPVPGETNIADNNLTDGWVIVAMPGDITGVKPGVPDGRVDIFDLIYLATSYGTIKGQSNYKPNADINDDGAIDIYDLIIIGLHYGQTDP